jgi:hypothetical protein
VVVRVHGHGKARGRSGENEQGSTAAAGSTGTKVYGNGSTAGQVVIAAGASANTQLYEPGKSRSHKMACGAHLIDVHALKSHLTICMGQTGAGVSAKAHGSGHGSVSGSAGGSVSGTAGVAGSTSASGAAGSHGQAGSGGVLGATASSPSSSPRTSAGSGVLGAAASSGVRSSTLPFTGFPLWLAGLAGAALLLVGVGLRRHGRTTA